MLSFFTNLNVGKKIGYGFALVTLVLALTVGVTMWRTSNVASITSRVVDLRVPTANASLMMVNGMNHSLAALRGWMLLGKEKFKVERGKAWSEEIEPSLETMKKFSVNWTDPANLERLKIIEEKLGTFRKYQEEIEAISQTPDNLPANKILFTEAAPQATILVKNITKIINIEATLAATSERKALLGMMADVRGTTARGLANIRAYLLSGNEKFKDGFDVMWKKNIKRFGDLTKNRSLLNAKQLSLFQEFTKARTVFAPLPPKMFEIRGGDSWNLSNKWLGTKAAPTAFAIKEELSGMIASQQSLLETDMTKTKQLSANLNLVLWGLLVVGALICGALGWFITRSISKPIELVTGVAQGLANGNLKQEQLVIDSKDELGVLAMTCNRLMDQLSNYIKNAEEILAGSRSELTASFAGDFKNSLAGMLVQAEERKKANIEVARVNSMMENAPINVIFADVQDFKIQYVNPASINTLKGIEQYLPCKVEELMGQCIDIFHKNPEHQRRILRDPKNLPHRAQINVGPEILDLLVSPIYNQNKEYLGPMVTWEVITQKVKADSEMARVNSIIENAPINIMFADRDFKVQYMNPASSKTLKSIEQHLPIKVDQMMGHSIDVFHKNPEHQRRLLSDPKNLPHQANIQVGPETLDLLVSPINDHQGNYLGAMVSWSVITEKLVVERQIKEAAEHEKEASATLQKGVAEIASIATTLASAAEELNSVSTQMGGQAEETSSQANVVSAAAEEVSKNIQSVATGSEEMSASIKEIAKNTSDSARVAAQAVTVAETTNTTVGKLGQSSAEISSIIKVINSIAEQTNLLALNATIEAARAGEAGKGFAVVANEVKELAKETTKATENIGRMIETIQDDTKGAVDAIGQISTIIKQVNDFQNTVASAVEEQTVTTNEMSRNVTEASKGGMEIASNISSVAQAANSTNEGTKQTKDAAEELAKMAANLQTVVSQLT